MLSFLAPVVMILLFGTTEAASCSTKCSDAPFLRDFELTASSETTKNKASEVFTVGWCAAQNNNPSLEVDFKQPFGIRSILVSGPTNRDGDPYPTNVLVKYVPNGGDPNNFVHFPLREGRLEIKLTQPGTAQSDFGKRIAVRKLQFTIQSFHGDACLKIDLLGCTINDLCTGGCQNGGLCVMQDICQCPQGTVGSRCESKECTSVDLGLADGRIDPDHIQVSSEDPVYNKAELGNSGSKKGWCPSYTDHNPWIQIELDQPKAVSVFSFMWSTLGNQDIMTEFELQYIAPIDSAKRFRTFATEIPAMNGTHIFTVTTEPVVVTDTIRIIPTASNGRACMKLEIKGCDPKALCSANFCQNGGTCMGENVCLCPSGFVGRQCELQNNQITATNMTFEKIYHNVITTATSILQFVVTGNVKFQNIANTGVVMINGTDSCIILNQTAGAPSCVTNVNLCTDGFTFSFDVSFSSLLDNTYIVASGGHLPGHSGITLYYTNNQLIYIVSTSTQLWTVSVDYLPVLRIWQHFELSWNRNLGVELLVNGRSLGSNSRPSGQPTTTHEVDLFFGCSHTSINVYKEMDVANVHMWSLDRTELVNAGILQPPSKSTTHLQSTKATTNEPIPSTTASTSTTMLTSYLNKYTTTAVVATASTSEPHLRFEVAISAKCTRHGWNISLDMNSLLLLYPGITFDDIYLSSEKCNGTLLNGDLWFQQSFESCRTRKEVIEGSEVFRNVLFYATFDPLDPTIVRQHIWTHNIACYVSTREETSSHLHHEVEYHSTNMTSHPDLTFTFFKDRNFLHQVPDNPLRVAVGDNLYVRVSTSIPDWDTKMRLHTCYTKSSDKIGSEHVLIKDGCEIDSSTHIISQSIHETKFVFRDFEYLTLNEGLDVFCNATFCDSSDHSPTCTQACRQSPSIVG